MTFLRSFFIGLTGAALSACAALDSFLATPTLIPPTETATPTPTVVWFPPTETPTPQVLRTRAPTPEMKPGVGKIIFSDNFTAPALWDPAANVRDHRLTLAAQNETYVAVLRRETVLDNFYAEIAAAPNLCRGADSYGLLIRARESAYYRFGLSCDGSVGAERIGGKSRQTLQAPLPSGDAPLGVGKVRVGVWAMGEEMRLFLNGRYQFSVKNPNYASGSIGIFVNSTGASPILVSFSNLSVREVK